MNRREGCVRADSVSWEVTGEGVRRKILGYDGSLMMVHVQFATGSIGPVHRHPHRQVTFVEQGTFEVQVGTRKSTLRTGDCFFIPPEVDHGVVALEEGSLVDVFTPAREDFLSSGK